MPFANKYTPLNLSMISTRSENLFSLATSMGVRPFLSIVLSLAPLATSRLVISMMRSWIFDTVRSCLMFWSGEILCMGESDDCATHHHCICTKLQRTIGYKPLLKDTSEMQPPPLTGHNYSAPFDIPCIDMYTYKFKNL